MSADFIHLKVHSEYSIVDGIVRIAPLIKQAAEDSMPAVALTDQCNLFALVKFYRRAVSAGIKPIIGSDILLHNDEAPDSPFVLTLLASDLTGYQNLTKIISRSYREGQNKRFVLTHQDWLKACSEGLIVLSGGQFGAIGHALLKNQSEQLAEQLDFFRQNFAGRFYLELHRVGYENESLYVQNAVELALKENLPVVATNHVRFLHEEDYDAHEARVCIHDGQTLQDPKRKKRFTAQQYFKTQSEMSELFADIPAALANTVEIAKRCNLSVELGKAHLPNFPTPNGQTIETYFVELAKQGLEERLDKLFTAEEKAKKSTPYYERLDIELDVILKMDFPGYFLVVADFIIWAKQNGVPVGPGRGSGAGSLVAYALGITDVDPLEFDLLFERFLNPERVSMPDFDVDFCMEGRDRVIQYVADKYGHESVSQIITFGTMAAKAVVRDVGRVLGHPYGFVDRIAKLIPFELGMTLEKALNESESLNDAYQKEDEVQELIELARKLEGVTRNAGKHAGGVVISPTVLTDFTPLFCEENGTNLVTQFDKDDVEAVGLVKFDFLGLRTLTIIDWALETVNAARELNGEPAIDIAMISKTDKKTFELIKEGQTTAVFQLESRGMKDLIIRLQPDCFEEIVALVALFRPGPLQSGMVDDFIDRKHGRAKVEYPHPDIASILQPTYGVILYQEQVMQIAQVLAGYSLGGADLLRRAMGKKKPEEMAKQREIFTKGALERGVDEKLATHIFDLMEKFAGYGFNKSHSVAYAWISYQTAWLKAHYPAAFMAAVLSSDMDNTDKVVNFIEDCRQHKITILPPDINNGFYKFSVKDERTVFYGLGAIKGVGKNIIEAVIAEREEKGPFKDFFGFVKRVSTHKLNRRVLEALIRAGAFDSLGHERSSMFASVDVALKLASQETSAQTAGQVDLFGWTEQTESSADIDMISVKPWPEKERLQGEKDTLGLYLTGHPINQYAKELSAFHVCPINQLSQKRDKKVLIAGLVIGIRTMKTKSGRRMSFLTLDDRTGRVDIAIFSDLYDESKDRLVKDAILIVEGNVSVDQYTGGYKIGANSVMDLDMARLKYVKCLQISIPVGEDAAAVVDTLKEVIVSHRQGHCPVVVTVKTDEAQMNISLGDKWHVRATDELLSSLNEKLGTKSAEYIYENIS